ARQANFNLHRHFWLPPGEYSVEVGAHDIARSQLATSRQTLRVSEPVGSSRLQTGDLLLVRQVDQINAAVNASGDPSAAAETEDPLVVGTRRIVPHLSREFEAGGLTELSFSLPVFPGKTSADAPRLKIELQRAGETIATTSPELPPADATGRILFIASIGTAKLRPGRYLLHALVTQGNEAREESVEFTLNSEAASDSADPDGSVSNQGDLPGALVATDRTAELTLHALKSTLPATITIDTLLADLRRSGEDLHRVIGEYTYSLRKVRRTLDSRGRVREEEFHDFEAYPIKGRHALIKLAENGARLDIRAIELNRRVATELLIRNETTGGDGQIGYWGAGLDGLITRRGQHREWASISIDPEIFFEVCEFSTPRLVTLDERETIVVDLSPKAGATLSPDREWIHRLTGTMWIDQADKTLVRIEAWKSAGGSPVTNFVYQQQRLAPGVWAPGLIRINSGGDRSLFNGLNWDAWFEFTSFKKFDTSRIEQKIEPSPK
ncbi:MAG: hypothetical protein EBZ36_14485, partial [Acidobacteria bacterium]|nr:hypothetical protein [Acidobacteriota bacterium]